MNKHKLRIYTSSSLHHAPLWIKLVEIWTEFQFTASWPEIIASGTTDDKYGPDFSKLFWAKDLIEVRASDCVLCYADPQDTPRGALIETGACLGLGKPVMLVGSNTQFGTWQHHPLVYRASELHAARQMLHYIARGQGL